MSTTILDFDFYRRMVEQAPGAMIFADREGIIRLWNAQAEAVFGYSESEAVGCNLDIIIPENLRDAHWRGYNRAIAEGKTKHGGKAMATRAMHKVSGKIYVEMSFSLAEDGHQGVLGALATARDITARYLAERAGRNPQ